ncbi:MAG: DNA-directed RNA polymerase subunit K [Thaumarchaeota archaeon]|nr:DNA-directed RNA polymerase subunit K [Nitrososphaerota archaeon]MCL5317932.1 DNA-directed RNA polymerase subunit K [Nitrososphaerota archaeon]
MDDCSNLRFIAAGFVLSFYWRDLILGSKSGINRNEDAKKRYADRKVYLASLRQVSDLRRLYGKLSTYAEPAQSGPVKKGRKKASTTESVAKAEGTKFVVKIGPPRLTRFEKARIIGARSLQLALGAPPFIPIPAGVTDPISLAIKEIESKALPISIRRMLPNKDHQDIPIHYLLSAF